jgi:hypothetical protein
MTSAQMSLEQYFLDVTDEAEGREIPSPTGRGLG